MTGHRLCGTPNVPRRLIGTGLLTFLAIVAVVAVACGGKGTERIVPSGVVETQSFDVDGFTRVSAGASFQLELSATDSFSVVVSADDNLLPVVEAQRHGDTLELGIKGPLSIDGNATLKAVVGLPVLKGIELDGATRAMLAGFREPGEVTIRASGASSVTGELSAGSIVVALSGASRATIEGFALSGDLMASGASRLELLDFNLAAASVDVSGASYAEVAVRDEITAAKASGASTIVYKGTPKVGNLDISGASSVSQY